MHPELRRSIWTRLVALGFIYLIVLGNVWVTYTVTGGYVPLSLRVAFFIGIFWVVTTAVGVLVHAVQIKRGGADPFYPTSLKDEDDPS